VNDPILRSNLRITFDETPSIELRNTLSRKIDEFNGRSVPYQHERFAFLFHDIADRLIGGLSGIVYWNWLFIDNLWIDDAAQGNGLGTELMRRAEERALAPGCHSAWLDTFQARSFYEKCGYGVVGALENYPAGQQRWFMQKRLLRD
jgi:GNAT superfamily N-acetyltransferase